MAPERFENYEVLRRPDGSLWELGRGGMGVTYKAFDIDLRCEVALKVIQPDLLDQEEVKHRFLREARSAARLSHPNIAAVFRLGKTAGDTYFYAMEFCPGDTVRQVVDERGPIEAVSACAIVLQVSRALVLADEHRLVHRDIKPANLILTESSAGVTVKVIDFGLAKSLAIGGSSWASMGTSGFVGTAHFASPEQLENREVDGRSDIYSLGATLWYMLTGKPVFSGSLARVVSQHLSAPVPWAHLDGLNVPPAARHLLARMLAKSPADRPQNARALLRAVDSVLDTLTAPAPATLLELPAAPPQQAPLPPAQPVSSRPALPPPPPAVNTKLPRETWQGFVAIGLAATLLFVLGRSWFASRNEPSRGRSPTVSLQPRTAPSAAPPSPAQAPPAHPATPPPVEAPPVEAPPVQPATPPPVEAWRGAIVAFVSGFVGCDEAGDAQSTLTYYAPNVDYFNEGRVNQAYIYNDITKYNQRWPVRRDSINGDLSLREIVPGQEYTAAYRLIFYVESAERGEYIRGDFSVYATIAVVNGYYRISAISEKVVSRQKGNLSRRR